MTELSGMAHPMGRSWGKLYRLFRHLQVMRRSVSRFRYPSELEHPTFMAHPLSWGPASHPKQIFSETKDLPRTLWISPKAPDLLLHSKCTRAYKVPQDAHLCLKTRENQVMYRWLTEDPLWDWAGNWVLSSVPVLVVWPEKTPYLMRLNDEGSGTDL